MNLLELLSRRGRQTPDKPAVEIPAEGGLGGLWTYSEIFSASRRLASSLRHLGLEAGDRVAFYLGNRIEIVTAYLALVEIGAVMVPVNLAYRRREIAHILTDAQPRLVLTEAAQLGFLDELDESERASVEQVLVAEELARFEAPSAERTTRTRHKEPTPIEPVRPDATALIMYTSGTTGQSKGAVLSHAQVATAVESLLEAWAWSDDDVLLLTLPLFHVHGLIVGLHCALAAGASVLLHRRFEAAAVADILGGGSSAMARPTLFFGVPTMYGRLVRELESRDEPVDLSPMRLFCSGSAPLDPELFRAFGLASGQTILERYGMTETCMLLSNPYDGRRRPGTVGLPLPGVSARIVDEAGSDLEDGSEGELLVSGANVFSGYWQAPEETARSFSVDDAGERWFHTGDLARQDPDSGYFTLLGRRHELILSGGFNIYPREIEEVLTTHASVREAAVVGRPHPEWGETPMAYLVVDEPVDDETLIEHCKAQIASFKVPRHYVVVETLPRNALGKVQKHLLPDGGV